MAGPTKEFWEQRFAAGDTPWDRGAVNPLWFWPKPAYPRTTHPRGLAELAVILGRRG